MPNSYKQLEGATAIRQLVEVPMDDSTQSRQATKITAALVEAISEVLAKRWQKPYAAPTNEQEVAEKIFMFYEDPFILPAGNGGRKTTPFHSSRAPSITLKDYVTRLFKYMKCSVECYILGLLLLERYYVAEGFPIDVMNAFRLYLVALSVCAKIRDDKFYSNKYYSEVGGISLAEFNALEVKFLFSLRWDTHVVMEEYEKMERLVLQIVYALTGIAAVQQVRSSTSSRSSSTYHTPNLSRTTSGQHHAATHQRTDSTDDGRLRIQVSYQKPQHAPQGFPSTSSLCSSVGPEHHTRKGSKSETSPETPVKPHAY